MNIVPKDSLKLKKEQLAELRATSSVRVATYQPDKATKPFTLEEYDVREIPTEYGTLRKVEFQLEGEATPFSFRVKAKNGIDADMPVKIQRHVAAVDFVCSNGTKINAGKVEWFAIQ